MKQTRSEITSVLVSVVIPVYNTADYVRQAVESICTQTLREIEIIIVDDGSSDNSCEILKELSVNDTRIRLYQQTNQGQSAARNTGMKYATGKYIYFMDSDDLLDNEALECCYHKCETQQLDFVFFDAEKFYDTEKSHTPDLYYSHTKGLEDKTYIGTEALEAQLTRHHFTPSPCLSFIRLSFLQECQIDFYPHILHEDQLFTMQLYLKAQRTGLIHRTFFHRRMRSNSIMTRCFTWNNMKGYLTVTRELLCMKNHFTTGQRALTDQFLSQMLDAAVWEGHALPLEQRIKLLMLCLLNHKRYVQWRTLAVLMLKRKK